MDTSALIPSSQTTGSASSAFFACHQVDATTATAVSPTCTTWRTPGMLITSMELLRRTRGGVPSEDEVREALAGNLCRCTGYQKIVDAVRAAAGAARRGNSAPRAASKPARRAIGAQCCG